MGGGRVKGRYEVGKSYQLGIGYERLDIWYGRLWWAWKTWEWTWIWLG
jgi:hypothetical protein